MGIAASDADGDGVEQAPEFGPCRGAATVHAGPFMVERADAVDEEHVQVDVEVASAASSACGKPMNVNKRSTRHVSERDDAPDLSADDWPERFARASVRRGRPPLAKPKVSTTIRLSQDVIDHFKAAGRGWQTRIDNALRDWIRTHHTP